MGREKPNMKISYRRTGGFAGMFITYDIDVDTLPPAEVDELGDLVTNADFFNLPSEIRSVAPSNDQFQYSLTIETNEIQYTVDVGDGAVPEKLQPLLNKLRILSRTA